MDEWIVGWDKWKESWHDPNCIYNIDLFAQKCHLVEREINKEI